MAIKGAFEKFRSYKTEKSTPFRFYVVNKDGSQAMT